MVKNLTLSEASHITMMGSELQEYQQQPSTSLGKPTGSAPAPGEPALPPQGQASSSTQGFKTISLEEPDHFKPLSTVLSVEGSFEM